MFEDKTICTDSLENISNGDAVTGFRFTLRLPSDRGMWLSLIGGIYLSVDAQEPFDQSALTLMINGKSYPVAELSAHPLERWGAFLEAQLEADYPGGLKPGVHTLDFGMVLLGGYFKAREEWVTNPPALGQPGSVHRFTCTLN